MVFKPADSPARWEGVAVVAWIALVQLLLVEWIRGRPTDWLRFVLIFLLLISVPALLYVLYRTWVAFSLEYWIDRNAITVRWADVRQTIPLAGVRQIVVNSEEVTDARTWWMDWPARYVHHGRPHETGHLALLASRPPEQCVILDAGEHAFALSPQAPDDFIEAVQERVLMGPVANVQLAAQRALDPVRILNTDRLGLILIAAGLLGSVLLFGALMVRFPGLPGVMAVRYSAEGIPELVRSKETLFLLPLIGLVAWIVNGLWGLIMAMRRQRPGAYLLWGGTLVVQLCAFLALVGLIGWR